MTMAINITSTMTKLYKSLICILGIGALFTGCQKAEQLVEEIDYSRVLTPLKFSSEVVASTGTDVVFTWQKMKNADGYELEIYEMLDDTEEVTSTSNGELVGESYILDADEVPFTVYGLEVDKTFYARVRGLSEKIKASNWAYLENTFSTSAVRSSLNPVVKERTATSVTIAWDKASDSEDLTSVLVETVNGDGESSKLLVTPEEIAGLSKTITDLEPAREYRFTLLFGKAGKRGSVAAFTRPVIGDDVNVVYSAGELYNAINNQTGEVKVQVNFSENGIDMVDGYPDTAVKLVNVTSDVYLYGVSTEEGKKPVISTLVFNLKAGATALHLEDLVFDGNGTGSLTENLGADMETIEYQNCEITGYTKGIYSVAATAAGANVAAFLVENCYVHDINADGTVGGDFIDIRNGQNGDLVLRNSTFYASARTFIRISDNAKVENVLVENCTFNQVTATNSSSNNAGIFAVRTVTEAKSIIARKNVFLNEISDGETQPDRTKQNADKSEPDAGKCFVRLNRNSTDSYAVDVENNVYYNVSASWWMCSAVGAPENPHAGEKLSDYSAKWGWNGDTKQYELTFLEEGGVLLDTDPCVNSIAGKMYLAGTAGEQITSMQVGDPRWWDAVQPVVVREKELKVQEDEFTWDFTEKTIYDTEELLENTIIGNARIYATATVPAKVVMSKGIDFSVSASVNPETGIPSYSAVEVLTSGYGSVKVMATSEDGLGAVQVLVAGDRYPVLADGKVHTVNLGDLTGENSIYVLANNAVTLKQITWTKDLTPDETVMTLATPELTVSPTKMEKGSEVDVVVSWNAVENAEDYVLTFNGAEAILSETSYTIPATDLAALAIGEYTVTVVARPVVTSSKYVASKAAEATFKINKPAPVGGEVTLTWDFSSAEWQAALAAAAPLAKGTNQANWTVTLDGLTYTSGSKNGKWDTTYIQPNGGGSATERVFSFTAPANGTLKITAASANSSETRTLAVLDATEVEQTKEVLEQTVLEFEVVAGDVLIYPKAGIRFFSIEFTYVGGAAAVDYVWNFSDSGWQAYFATLGGAGKDLTPAEGWNHTEDGLTFTSTQKNRYTATALQIAGAGSKTERVLTFDAPVAGTVSVASSNTGNSEANPARNVIVAVGDAEGEAKSGGSPSGSDPTVNEWAVSAGKIYIYTDQALRIYTVEFHSN